MSPAARKAFNEFVQNIVNKTIHDYSIQSHAVMQVTLTDLLMERANVARLAAKATPIHPSDLESAYKAGFALGRADGLLEAVALINAFFETVEKNRSVAGAIAAASVNGLSNPEIKP